MTIPTALLILLAACASDSGDLMPPASARCVLQLEVSEKPCVVRGDHTLWCGTPLVRSTVFGGDDVAEVVAGTFPCVRKLDGTVWCEQGNGAPAPDAVA